MRPLCALGNQIPDGTLPICGQRMSQPHQLCCPLHHTASSALSADAQGAPKISWRQLKRRAPMTQVSSSRGNRCKNIITTTTTIGGYRSREACGQGEN